MLLLCVDFHCMNGSGDEVMVDGVCRNVAWNGRNCEGRIENVEEDHSKVWIHDESDDPKIVENPDLEGLRDLEHRFAFTSKDEGKAVLIKGSEVTVDNIKRRVVWNDDPADHDGKELSNDKLAHELERTTTFTQEDLAKLGVQDLLPQHYIKSVNSYFRPVKDDAALGLTWAKIVGDPADYDGEVLSNDKLAHELERTTTFTQQDLAKLGVQDLLPQHYIKSVDSYFRPVKDEARRIVYWPNARGMWIDGVCTVAAQ